MAAAEAAAAMVERLEALACPALSPGSLPVSPAEALSLLCHPSELRKALLEWICIRIHPPLAALLESLPEGERMRELAKLGAKLMLCGDDDLALVEGSAPPEQQLQFFQDLLDAAPPVKDPQKTRSSTRSTRFLLELLETPEGRAALRPPEPPPLPLQPPDSPPGPRRPLPELQVELGELRQGLEQLQAKLSALGVSPPPCPPHLGVLGGTLASLIAAFGVSELRDPLGAPREKPQKHPCGPPSQNVGRGLRGLGQVLGSLAELGAAAGEVTELGAASEEIQPQIPPICHRF